jgi:RNA polymerase sigma factor (sigma-70 family)
MNQMMNQRSDEEWIRLLKQDNPQAVHDLWILLYTYAVNAKRRYHTDDDATQTAVLEAYTRIRTRGVYQFRFDCPFPAYCRVILIRELLRLLKERASNNIENELDEEKLDPADQQVEAPPPSRPVQRALLQPCLDQLTSREREIIQRRYFERQDPQTVADHLGLSRNNLNVITHRARLKLKVCLESRGYRSSTDLT